jgi:hypothetical protein
LRRIELRRFEKLGRIETLKGTVTGRVKDESPEVFKLMSLLRVWRYEAVPSKQGNIV